MLPDSTSARTVLIASSTLAGSLWNVATRAYMSPPRVDRDVASLRALERRVEARAPRDPMNWFGREWELPVMEPPPRPRHEPDMSVSSDVLPGSPEQLGLCRSAAAGVRIRWPGAGVRACVRWCCGSVGASGAG